MRSFFKLTALALALVCVPVVAKAQAAGNIQLTTTIMPPYTTNYYDYIEKTRVTVIGNGAYFLLRINIKGANGITMRSKMDFYVDPHFASAGQMVVLTANDLYPYFDFENLFISGIDPQQLQTHGLPPGRYQICFQAFDRSLTTALSMAEPAGCSSYFEIKDLQPPVLIRPVCGRLIKYQEIQNVIFSWAPVTGAPPSTPYTLRIVEIPIKGQSPGDALLSATSPAFFEETFFGQTSFFYGPAQPQLEIGKSYAWEVIAGSAGAMADFPESIKFANNGRSQPCSFTIHSDMASDIIADKPKIPGGVEIMPGGITIGNIPHSIIKGKLEFRFLKTEEHFNPEPILPVKPSTPFTPINNQTQIDTYFLGDANISSELQNNPEQEQQATLPGGNIVNVSISQFVNMEQSSSVISNAAFTQTNIPVLEMGAVAIQDPYLSKGGIKVYPGENIKVDLYVDLSKLTEVQENNGVQFQNFQISTGMQTGISQISNKVKIGSVVTNEQGEFSLVMFNPNVNGWPTYIHNGKKYIVNQVIVNPVSPYVDFPEKILAIPKNEEAQYNIGTINGIAKTYRLMPHAVDATNPDVNLDAEIRIYRKSSLYSAHPLLKSEGGRKIPEIESSGQIQIQPQFQFQLADPLVIFSVSKTSKSIARLFYAGGSTDEYIVTISAPGYNTLYTTVRYLLLTIPGFKGKPYIDDAVKQYEQIFKLTPKPPSVTAVVLDKQTNYPLEGLTASLTRQGVPMSKTAKTDQEGRFSIKNVSPSQTAYTLSLNGSTISPYTHPTTINVFQGGLDIDLGVIYVDARFITVVGKVFDMENKPLSDASVTLKGKPGEGNSDVNGRFMLKATPGNHTLVVSKPGYKTQEKNITVPENPGGQNNNNLSLVENWASNLQQTQWFKGEQGNPEPAEEFKPITMGLANLNLEQVQQNNTLSGQLIYSQSLSEYNGLMANLIDNLQMPGNQTPLVYDVGIIKLQKFLVEVVVKDQVSGDFVANASVSMHQESIQGTTGGDGKVILENVPFGNVDLLVKGPDDKNYIARFMNVLIEPVSNIQNIEVLLEEGARLSGSAFSDNQPLASVNISLDGMEFINAQTNASGQYILNGIPLGYQTFKASKPGYIGEQKSLDVKAGDQQLDFNLENPGFVADKLLGFDIVLESWNPGADTTITGYFTNIAGNAIYQWVSNTNLSFSNQKITIKNGIPEPKGTNEIITETSQVNIKVLGIPMILENLQQIRIRKGTTSTSGFIMGTVRFNPQTAFPDLQHLSIPASKKLYLKHQQKANETPLEIFSSAGNLPYTADDLRFYETGTGTWKIYQFDFTPMLAQTSLKNDGIRFKGQINVTGIQGINQLVMGIGELWLTPQGKIQSVTLASSPQPTFKLFTWDFTITGGSINQYGITTAGTLKVPVPSSPVATINFSQLFLTPSGISSGQFYSPAQGIDIFEIVKFKTQGSTSLTFGKQPGQNAYYLVGTGNVQLPKYIPGNVKMTSFRIQTNNIFEAEAETNLNMNFADVAKIKINSLGFHAGNNPRIRVNGDFELNIPFIQVAAGGIDYRRNNQVSVDKLSIGFNLASVAKATANVEFKTNGFAGGGGLKINQTPIDVGINFNYQKQGSGTIIEADFVAGVVIPVGVLTINKVRGGFSYNSAQQKYTITVMGAVTIAPGTEYLVSLDPISVTVGGGPGGPIMEGSATAKVLTWSLAQANLVLNYPDRYFSVDAKIGGGFNLIPKLSVQANQGVILAISGKPDNRFWLTGFYSNASLAGLFNASTNIVAAWNLNRNQNPQFMPYLMFIPDAYLTNGHTLNGFYLKNYVFFGRKSDNPWTFSFGIGNIKTYFYNESYAELYANFLSMSYGMLAGSGWGGGGSVSLFGIGAGGVGVDAKGELYGGYQNSHWNFGGSLGAKAKGWVGKCSGGCKIGICTKYYVPIGGQICVNKTLNVDYSTSTGKVSVSLD
jgi:hypothetical protein